jgi:hypothetical protein
MISDRDHLKSLPSVDAEFCFGRPKIYLTPHELARLTIVRSKLGETRADRAAERIPSQPSAGRVTNSLGTAVSASGPTPRRGDRGRLARAADM